MLTTHVCGSKREGDAWLYVLTIKDRSIYKRYMEDIKKATNYGVVFHFSMVELEDEMESLFVWGGYVVGVGHGFFAIGKVKE